MGKNISQNLIESNKDKLTSDKELRVHPKPQKIEKKNRDVLDKELRIFLLNEIDWKKLRFQADDEELYRKLIVEVKQAYSRKESFLQLHNRLKKLGVAGMSLAKKISRVVSNAKFSNYFIKS